MHAYLKKAGKPLMPADIRNALKAKPASVSTTLHRLRALGKVKHTAKGWTA